MQPYAPPDADFTVPYMMGGPRPSKPAATPGQPAASAHAPRDARRRAPATPCGDSRGSRGSRRRQSPGRRDGECCGCGGQSRPENRRASRSRSIPPFLNAP